MGGDGVDMVVVVVGIVGGAGEGRVVVAVDIADGDGSDMRNCAASPKVPHALRLKAR